MNRLVRSIGRVVMALGVVAALGLVGGAWWLALPGTKHVGPLPAPAPGHAEVAARLEADVRMLCDTIGERSWRKPENLAKSVFWIETELKDAGLVVTRQNVVSEAGTFQNVIGTRRGTDPAAGVVVVGAHYDSFPGTIGADDNASGVAGVLAIARALKGLAPAAELRFVAFASEESHFQTDAMGSLVYARSCRQAGDDLRAVVDLETIATYSDEPGSQRFPLPALAWLFPDRGDFVAFVADPTSRPLMREMVRSFRSHAAFPSEGVALPADVPGVGWSDHWAFWQAGYQAVMVSDTAPFRNERYHTTHDMPDKLDYARTARVVQGVAAVVTDLAAAPPR